MSRKGEDAAFYEAHRDDPDLWGEPEDPGEVPQRTGLTATITVRFSAEEAEAIRRVAREAKLTYSEVVRKSVQTFIQPKIEITRGGTYHWFQQYDATRVVETVTFEGQHGSVSDTRTGSLFTTTGD